MIRQEGNHPLLPDLYRILLIQTKRGYPAGVAAPASLLTAWVRGCNEIYHLR